MKIVRRDHVPDEDRGGYIIKRLVTTPLKLNTDNYGLYETITPKGSECSLHYHAELHEVIYFITKGKLMTKDGVEEMGAGDLVVLDPGDAHGILADENDVINYSIKLPNDPADKFVV